MGAVYLARDVRMDRLVAVKIPPPQILADRGLRERFLREAQMTVKVSHECLVQGFSAGEVEGVPYFVMEYVPGRSLQDVLVAEARLSEGRAGALAADVCGALTALHGAGVVHRDIKPDNIRATDDGRVKLVDFGLAVDVTATRMSAAGSVMGTLEYMAPEQHRSALDVDQRSDVFALGATLHHLVTGTPLFQSNVGDLMARIDEIHRQKASESYRPLFVEGGPLSRELAAVLERALRYHPAHRFTSAAELRAAIEAVPSVRMWRGGSDGASDPIAEPAPRRWLPGLVLAAIVLIAAAALQRPAPPLASTLIARAIDHVTEGNLADAVALLDGFAASDPLATSAQSLRADLAAGTVTMFQSQTHDATSAILPIQALGEVRLSGGDQFRLAIRTTFPCWLYVFALDSSGSGGWIFPDAVSSPLSNPLPANTLTWLPSSERERDWYRLDDRRGRDTLFVIGVRQDLPDPADIGRLIVDRPDIDAVMLAHELGRSPGRPAAPVQGCFPDGPVRIFGWRHE